MVECSRLRNRTTALDLISLWWHHRQSLCKLFDGNPDDASSNCWVVFGFLSVEKCFKEMIMMRKKISFLTIRVSWWMVQATASRSARWRCEFAFFPRSNFTSFSICRWKIFQMGSLLLSFLLSRLFFRNNYDCLEEGIHHNCTIKPDGTRQLSNWHRFFLLFSPSRSRWSSSFFPSDFRGITFCRCFFCLDGKVIRRCN